MDSPTLKSTTRRCSRANLIVVQVDGRNFRRFSELHEFDKPNDLNALDLMNSCAEALLNGYQGIVFSYGFSDEFCFQQDFQVLPEACKEFFPQKDLMRSPSFRARVICCASVEVVQYYLAWRQNDCHISNQYDVCFWKLIESGKTESEARETLKGATNQEKNELLFQQFGINYKKLPEMLRQGSCILKTKVCIVRSLVGNNEQVYLWIPPMD